MPLKVFTLSSQNTHFRMRLAPVRVAIQPMTTPCFMLYLCGNLDGIISLGIRRRLSWCGETRIATSIFCLEFSS